MEITKADLETRIEALTKLRLQHLSDADALGGAIQDCQFWVSRLAAEETPVEKPPALRAVE